MKFLDRIFNRTKAKPSSAPASALTIVTGETLTSWRANQALCESLRSQMDTELMRRFMSVLYNSIPSGYPERGQVVNDTMANIELGRNQGHLGVINLIQVMQIPSTKTEEIEQDYGAERIADKWSDS